VRGRAAFSVEKGKKIEFNADWTVALQAQLVYSNARFKAFDDVFGSRVSHCRVRFGRLARN
jgi:hypothetical protein